MQSELAQPAYRVEPLKIAAVVLAAGVALLAWRAAHDVRPKSLMAERLQFIRPDVGLSYRARAGDLGKLVCTDSIKPLVIYEGMVPLSPEKFSVGSEPCPNRSVIFSASDNSDPRTNGREYWAVLPK